MDPLQNVIRLEMPADIAEALTKLTPEQRAVFDAAFQKKLGQLLPLVLKVLSQADALRKAP